MGRKEFARMAVRTLDVLGNEGFGCEDRARPRKNDEETDLIQV